VSDRDEGFLSRWSRRKAQLRTGVEAEPAPAAAAVVATPSTPAPPVAPLASDLEPPLAAEAPPLPTMDDVAALTRESDYARFVMPGVDDGVKSAAMKKLFSDPHFNVMDGLDTYIDDYNKPDPIPLAMLRQMNQSKFLGLFDDEQRDGERDDNPRIEPMQGTAQVPPPEAATDAAQDPIADDHDADLQLQPDDDAGRPGPEPGAGA
jgi:hypothetical protein